MAKMSGRQILLSFGLALTLLASLATATNHGCCWENECTCEPNCWEKCFMDPPNNNANKNAYMEIYRAAIGIRNLYAPCFKPHGTAYMMDSDVPSSTATEPAADLYQYQRHLASIIAMVQPVGDSCNPFCASKFYQRFAYYSHGWPCMDKCEAWQFFNSDSQAAAFRPNQNWRSKDEWSWVGGGEILADICFNYNEQRPGHECMKCSKNELLVAFTNSPVMPVPGNYCGGNPFQCAAIGIAPSNLMNLDAWANTGPAYHLPSNPLYMKAAGRIAKCMYKHCCSKKFTTKNTWWSPSKTPLSRQTNGEQVYEYTTPDFETTLQFKGSFEEFNEKILRRFLNGGGSTGINDGIKKTY